MPLLVLVLVLAGAAAAAERLTAYTSPPLTSSAQGVIYRIGYPLGWKVAWGGERTRFYPAEAEGPRLSLTYIHVDAIPRDSKGAEAFLNERDGVELWLRAVRPRYEIEDRRRVKVGPKGESRDAWLVKDPAGLTSPDRRVLIVLVPVADVNFLIRCSAPLKEYGSRDALFRAVLETFEVGGA